MSTQLIPVFTGEINQTQQSLCDARELYRFLEMKQCFGNWIANRIKQYQFVENIDYCSFVKIYKRTTRGASSSKQYHLTLDTAKELAMVERNDKGREARRYFIDCERRLLSNHPLTDNKEHSVLQTENTQLKAQLAQQAEMLELYRFKANALEQQAGAKKPKRKGTRPITQNEINAIHALHEQGLSNKEIAHQISRSTASVSYVLRGVKVGVA